MISIQADEALTTSLMIETLQDSLSCLWDRQAQIAWLRRSFLAYSSSFRSEHLQVFFQEGERLDIFFKDLNPEHQLADARRIGKSQMDSSRREYETYRRILSRHPLGTAQLYAFRWQPEREIFWLFLEYLPGLRLSDVGDFGIWLDAARWAARFHAASRDLTKEETSFLPAYDRSYYWSCVKPVYGKLAQFGRHGELIERALELFEKVVCGFDTLPHSVIHGEYFAHNILLRENGSDHTIAVVDWETAAIGPSFIDLLSLTSGSWTAREREAMWRAYFDGYRSEAPLPLDWSEFCAALQNLALFQCLKCLGWMGKDRDHVERWTKELEKVVSACVS